MRITPSCSLNVLTSSHPVWLCGFRPFFLLAALSATLLIALWLGFLSFGLPLPRTPGGPFVWHAHEMLFGFGLAAMAGFSITALPEFTRTAPLSVPQVRWLVTLWLLARIAFWSSAWLDQAALLVAGASQALLLACLLYWLTPRLWQQPERRHLSFAGVFAALLLLLVGCYHDLLQGLPPTRWLLASLGLMMVLIVVALSRISMRVVNEAIEAESLRQARRHAGQVPQEQLTTDITEYRARPPRRNLAIFCITLYTLAEFLLPGSRLSGWLALAAAAAILNLLNDWHVGRALLRRWPLMLYGVYVLMAAGYGVMGLSLLTSVDLDLAAVSAGRHLLAVGSMGLSIFAVLNIAGRTHSGYPLDERLWLPLVALLLFAAALSRAAAGLSGPDMEAYGAYFNLAALLWLAGYGLWLHHFLPLLLGPRPDDKSGCAAYDAEG